MASDKPIPVNVHFPPDLLKRVDAIAEEEQRSRRKQIIVALREWVTKRQAAKK